MEFLNSNNMFGLAQLKVDYARKHTISRSVNRLKNKPSLYDLSCSGMHPVYQTEQNMAD
jgi:hypothetical protein